MNEKLGCLGTLAALGFVVGVWGLLTGHMGWALLGVPAGAFLLARLAGARHQRMSGDRSYPPPGQARGTRSLCERCKADLPPGAAFCPTCGHRASP